MPYPNEHSARLENPDKYKRFRRQNDKFGSGIDAIFGILPSDKTEVQAIRFSASKFTPEQAKAWIKEHKHSIIKFETATKTDEDDLRGTGQGVGGKKAGDGGAAFCVCPECGFKKEHERGTPCNQIKCTRCGTAMVGTTTKIDGSDAIVSDSIRFDFGTMRGQAIKTDEGYIRGDAIVTRIGILLYRNDNGSVRRELRHPDDVFASVSLDSMKMIPITNNHPPVKLLNKNTAKKYSVGTTGERIRPDSGKFVMCPFIVTDEIAINDIDKGKREFSLGYKTDLLQEGGEYDGQQYDVKQTNIRYNHLAIVNRARAGAEARIHIDGAELSKEEADEIDVSNSNNNNNLKKKERKMPIVKIDGIDYEAAQEVSNALGKANAKIDSLTGEAVTAKTGLDKVTGEKDALQAKIDALPKEEDVKKNLAIAVKDRLDIEAIAKRVLKADALKNLASIDNDTIKKAVIMEVSPKAKLDDASDVYINARYDSIVETLPVDKKDDKKKKPDATNHDKDDMEPEEKARTDMAEADKNAWKGEEKKEK